MSRDQASDGRVRSAGLLLLALLAITTLPAASDMAAGQAPSPTPSPASTPADRAAVQAEAYALAGTGDWFDTLYFGWFDRPYARASLACVLTALPPPQAGPAWCQFADTPAACAELAAVLRNCRAPARWAGFYPHRLPVLDAADGSPALQLPVWALLQHSPAGDDARARSAIDLQAALGLRGYAIPASEWALSAAARRRATALGMVALTCAGPAAEPGDEPAVVVRPVSLCEVLSPDFDAARDRDRRTWALATPAGGETPAAALARFALIRGLRGDGEVWTVGPAAGWSAGELPLATRVWSAALAGQRLTVLTADESLSAAVEPLAPLCAWSVGEREQLAHGILDLQRLAPAWAASPAVAPVAVLVPATASATDDAHAWADWTLPYWQALLDRQVRFDVLPADAPAGAALRSRYRAVVPLTPQADGRNWINRLELRLAAQAEHTMRLTARAPTGPFVTDVQVVTGPGWPDAGWIGLVNLQNEPRSICLRGGPPLPALRDVLCDEAYPASRGEIRLAPGQVRLLRPAGRPAD